MATMAQEQYGFLFALIGGLFGTFIAAAAWYLTLYTLLGLTLVSLVLGGVAILLGVIVGVLIGSIIGIEYAKKRRY